MSKRLSKLTELCKNVSTTVDVGCDHGYIGCDLLKQNKTKFLIATDISAPSLEKAKKLIAQSGFSKNADFRVGNGLEVIKENEKTNQVVIAGMGGCEIVKIIQNFKARNDVDWWILQPMNEVAKLREFLNQNNFKIETDLIVEDDKFYHMIIACCGKQNLSQQQIEFGINFENDLTTDYFNWLNYKSKKFKEIIKKLPKNNQKISKLNNCIEKIENIKQIYKEKKKC